SASSASCWLCDSAMRASSWPRRTCDSRTVSCAVRAIERASRASDSMSRSRRASSSWVAAMRLRVSYQASAARPPASRTAISTSTGMRDERVCVAGGAAGSVSGIEICYQPLEQLVVARGRNHDLLRAMRARLVGDALVRYENGKAGDQLVAAHGAEIVERLCRPHDERMDLAAPPCREKRRGVARRLHPPVAHRVLDHCTARGERLRQELAPAFAPHDQHAL